VATANQKLLHVYHISLMARHNIFFLPGKMGCFSDSHSAHDLERFISATKDIVESGVLN
jgi:glutamate-1-semialdehyde 2,1-aminomutase